MILLYVSWSDSLLRGLFSLVESVFMCLSPLIQIVVQLFRGTLCPLRSDCTVLAFVLLDSIPA